MYATLDSVRGGGGCGGARNVGLVALSLFENCLKHKFVKTLWAICSFRWGADGGASPSSSFGDQKWSKDDIIGAGIDLNDENPRMEFFLNGKTLQFSFRELFFATYYAADRIRL